jgi:hypothetical protein
MVTCDSKKTWLCTSLRVTYILTAYANRLTLSTPHRHTNILGIHWTDFHLDIYKIPRYEISILGDGFTSVLTSILCYDSSLFYWFQILETRWPNLIF